MECTEVDWKEIPRWLKKTRSFLMPCIKIDSRKISTDSFRIYLWGGANKVSASPRSRSGRQLTSHTLLIVTCIEYRGGWRERVAFSCNALELIWGESADSFRIYSWGGANKVSAPTRSRSGRQLTSRAPLILDCIEYRGGWRERVAFSCSALELIRGKSAQIASEFTYEAGK